MKLPIAIILFFIAISLCFFIVIVLVYLFLLVIPFSGCLPDVSESQPECPGEASDCL